MVVKNYYVKKLLKKLVEEAYGQVVKIYEKVKMQVEGCMHEIN
jgi:hypothetical protein